MGLVGLLCAALGAASVLLTDYEPVVVSQIQNNMRLNNLQTCCTTRRLDFRQQRAGPAAEEQQEGWDLVLAADVLYVGALAAPLAQTLALLLHQGGGCWGA
jgi:predicted nicotinamide N-methyase